MRTLEPPDGQLRQERRSELARNKNVLMAESVRMSTPKLIVLYSSQGSVNERQGPATIGLYDVIRGPEKGIADRPVLRIHRSANSSQQEPAHPTPALECRD